MKHKQLLIFLALLVAGFIVSNISIRPVKATSTGYFGNTHIGSSDFTTGYELWGTKFTSPSNCGTITTVSVYFCASILSVWVKARGDIYSDASGVPTTLLAQSATVDGIGTTPSWINFSFNYVASPNTVYWLSFYPNASSTLYYDAGATSQTADSYDGDWNAPPSPFNVHAYNSYNCSFYATYTYTSTSITITSSPTGSGYVTVDGSAITTPHTYTWNTGDSHTIAANSPVTVVSGQSQYLWSSWSDSGTQSHSIIASPSTTTYTASFQLQYYLAVAGGNGPSGSGWYNSGSAETVSNTWIWSSVSGQSRTALLNYYLDTVAQNPSRSNTGNYTTPTITMSAAHNVTFTNVTQYYLTVTGGNSVSYGTASPTGDNWYDSGTSTTVSSSWVWNTVTGQNRTAITNWQLDGVNENPARQGSGTLTTSSVSLTTYHTVAFVSATQYFLAVSGGNNISYGTSSPTGDNWYDSGAASTVLSDWVWSVVTSQSRTALTNYAVDGVNKNPARQGTGTLTTISLSFTASNHTVVFASVTQYYVTLTTATSSVGQSGSQTGDGWYDSGTSASVSATTPYTNTTATFVFLSWTWSRGGAQPSSSNNPFSISMTNYVNVTAVWDAVPVIGQFQAPVTVYANKYLFLNATIVDADGQADFNNAQVQISNNVVLSWNSGVFSVQSDSNHYCTLDAANSVSVTVNSTAYTLAWKVRVYWNYTEGAANVNGTVVDDEGWSGIGSLSSIFTFEHNLIIASGSVNVTRTNPSSSVKFTGQIYYQGTSTAPESMTGITAYASLSGLVVGSNSSIASNGQFQITVTSESSIGTYTYTLYSVTSAGTSTTNQTLNFIVETVTLTFNGPFRINVGANCSGLTVSGVYTTDSSPFTGTITLNDTTFLHITVGRRDFRVASISGGSYGITALANNPTTYCIWEALNVTITPNSTNPSAGQTVNFTVTATYLSDGSNVSSFNVNILRDSAHYSSSSTFTDHSDSQVTHIYTTENMTDLTYGITVFIGNTATVAWGNLFVEVNQINPGALNLNVGSASLSLYHCRWSSNQSNCVDGTIYVNGTGFSINSTGWASVAFNFATVGLRVLNLTGVSVEGVTLFGQIPANPQIVWNRVLIASGGISSSYLHVGGSALVYYTVEYEYDLSSITDGTVLLNGSAMLFNPLLNRWEENVSSASLGSYSCHLTSVSGNHYGITVLNDVAGYLNCTFYADLNIRTVDVDGNLLNQTVVYMNNGSATTIPSNLPPGTGIAIVGATSWLTRATSSGWANWTGITNSTLHIYATWYGLTVNSTFTLTMTGDMTLDVVCLCYPFTVSGTLCWAASNATISNAVYALNILTLQFSGSAGNYLLVSSCTTLPSYVTNVAYDLSKDFTLGYLQLPHFGNTTIQLSYESWGGTLIMASDHPVNSVSLVANNMTAFFTGNSGDIGTVKVFCGSRGNAVDNGGFTTSNYQSGVLTGNYVFPNSTYGVWLSWLTYGGGPSTTPTVANLIISINLGFPSLAQVGQPVDGTLNVTWSGASGIYLWSMVCGGEYSDWMLTVPQGLPMSLESSTQFESVPLNLTMSQNATAGTYQVPCTIVFANNEGATKTFQTVISVTLVAPSASGNIVTYIFLGLFGSIGIGMLFGGNEVRKRRRAATPA